MKHLLNNLTEEEKNSIREQHVGGMKVMNENFHKMVNKKLGHVELISEQTVVKDDPNDEWGESPPGGHYYQENNLGYDAWFNKYEPQGGSTYDLRKLYKKYRSGEDKHSDNVSGDEPRFTCFDKLFAIMLDERDYKMPESCEKFNKDKNFQNGASCIADLTKDGGEETVEIIKCIYEYLNT